jgi:selenophosphate synthase
VRGATGEGSSVDPEDPRVLAVFDPQTSGGLLMAVAAEKHAALLTELAGVGASAWTIGQVTSAPRGRITLVTGEPDASDSPR